MKRKSSPDMRALFVAWGSIGGKQRAKNLTPAERSSIASKAARARERNRRAKEGR